MTMPDTQAAVALSIVTVCIFTMAGVVKGVVGLGLPTVSMALLALMMAPADAAALLIVPSLVTNLWQIQPWSSSMAMLRRLGPMQLGVCVGTLAGSLMLGPPAGSWASMALGVALAAYAIWALAGVNPAMPLTAEKWLAPSVGVATGFVTAATGVFVVPAVPYLQALRLQRDELIQAMGISFTVSTAALAVGLCLNGQFSIGRVGQSTLMLVPALVGMQLGQSIRRRLSPARFRRWFFLALMALGAYIIAQQALKG